MNQEQLKVYDWETMDEYEKTLMEKGDNKLPDGFISLVTSTPSSTQKTTACQSAEEAVKSIPYNDTDCNELKNRLRNIDSPSRKFIVFPSYGIKEGSLMEGVVVFTNDKKQSSIMCTYAPKQSRSEYYAKDKEGRRIFVKKDGYLYCALEGDNVFFKIPWEIDGVPCLPLSVDNDGFEYLYKKILEMNQNKAQSQNNYQINNSQQGGSIANPGSGGVSLYDVVFQWKGNEHHVPADPKTTAMELCNKIRKMVPETQNAIINLGAIGNENGSRPLYGGNTYISQIFADQKQPHIQVQDPSLEVNQSTNGKMDPNITHTQPHTNNSIAASPTPIIQDQFFIEVTHGSTADTFMPGPDATMGQLFQMILNRFNIQNLDDYELVMTSPITNKETIYRLNDDALKDRPLNQEFTMNTTWCLTLRKRKKVIQVNESYQSPIANPGGNNPTIQPSTNTITLKCVNSLQTGLNNSALTIDDIAIGGNHTIDDLKGSVLDAELKDKGRLGPDHEKKNEDYVVCLADDNGTPAGILADDTPLSTAFKDNKNYVIVPKVVIVTIKVNGEEKDFSYQVTVNDGHNIKFNEQTLWEFIKGELAAKTITMNCDVPVWLNEKGWKVSANCPHGFAWKLDNVNINTQCTNLPTANSNMPGVNASVPTVNTNLPGVNANLPGVNASIPTVNASVPTVNTNLPGVNANLPGVNTNLPMANTTPPIAKTTINISINFGGHYDSLVVPSDITVGDLVKKVKDKIGQEDIKVFYNTPVNLKEDNPLPLRTLTNDRHVILNVARVQQNQGNQLNNLNNTAIPPGNTLNLEGFEINTNQFGTNTVITTPPAVNTKVPKGGPNPNTTTLSQFFQGNIPNINIIKNKTTNTNYNPKYYPVSLNNTTARKTTQYIPLKPPVTTIKKMNNYSQNFYSAKLNNNGKSGNPIKYIRLPRYTNNNTNITNLSQAQLAYSTCAPYPNGGNTVYNATIQKKFVPKVPVQTPVVPSPQVVKVPVRSVVRPPVVPVQSAPPQFAQVPEQKLVYSVCVPNNKLQYIIQKKQVQTVPVPKPVSVPAKPPVASVPVMPVTAPMKTVIPKVVPAPRPVTVSQAQSVVPQVSQIQSVAPKVVTVKTPVITPVVPVKAQTTAVPVAPAQQSGGDRPIPNTYYKMCYDNGKPTWVKELHHINLPNDMSCQQFIDHQIKYNRQNIANLSEPFQQQYQYVDKWGFRFISNKPIYKDVNGNLVTLGKAFNYPPL